MGIITVTQEQLGNMRNYILNIYKKTNSLDIIEKLFEQSFKLREPQVRGELAEIFLEIKAREFSSKNKGVLYIKNMVVPTKSGKTTEIDLVMASRKKIILFESKSYNGSKTLTGKGDLTNKSGTIDVYGQSEYHLKEVDKYFNKIRTASKECYKIVMFSYARGELKDTRDNEWKNKLPLIDSKNIDEFLEETLLMGEDKWDIYKVRDAFTFLNTNRSTLIDEHLKRVK